MPFTQPASLDTEPVASSYSGETLTHSSSTISSTIRSPLGYFAIPVFSMIVPEMIAPFYVIFAANSQLDFATIWSPYHTFRSHLAESTFTPVNFVFLGSNGKRDLDWSQALIIDEDAIPE